ncbi:hypothetical protein NLX83_08520 [Allokutzneria sp. A3M-2-11 16]|uniref:hypothetical protein n=1 Tax=Allokutzneria sp. A3M-2-11 16 TaxID=2962043 RepID=UPI0020B84727|nr:hypothetical protein [Allokutzneria sp. A3M-2-11 16]MCP3799298.1 hypothetical protein [Allokutzneria sp. A3M-2-11 16]
MALEVTEAALTEQLVRLVTGHLLDPLEILLGTDWTLTKLERRTRTQAAVWAKDLLGPNDRVAAQTAMRLVATLYPSDGPFDPPAAWWQAPLGQVVAHRVGHPTTDGLSYSTAGAMLGITKQAVHDLVNRGKLVRHSDGGVTSESVRLRLHQRNSREG